MRKSPSVHPCGAASLSLLAPAWSTRVPGGLGGAYVWALKDDDANGTLIKTMADFLGH